MSPSIKKLFLGPNPPLFLAPMEGLGDRAFRKTMARVGGFDQACTEFIRIPRNAHIPSLSKVYDPQECAPLPLAAQIMGSDLELVPEMARALEAKGAPRIDLNCGCPSNTVVGRGAGSSLLKDPDFLHVLIKAIRKSVTCSFSVKMRSGFEDDSLFLENLKAIEEGGAEFITLHPRTKVEGYKPPAHWDLIALAKQNLNIPLVGNGDIQSPDDALRMLQETNCDGLMIGRTAAARPWIFWEIRSAWGENPLPKAEPAQFLSDFYAHCQEMPPKNQTNKIKQILRYLLRDQPDVMRSCLRERPSCPELFLEQVLSTVG